ncbi:MAG: tail fiber domain-containing protein [bacterium]|nr:tail fiber domain-containing protein [bacterium]
MFDAYTVKKVLPRLVIAAILIQISWEMFNLLIEVVNQVAFGIEGLLYAPFGGKEALAFKNIVSNSKAGALEFTFFTSIAVVGGGFALGTLGIMSLAVTALLALFIGYVVLVLRQAIIVGLLVISPIALVAWILPNTEKVWKVWWDSFFKLLLMYPLVLLMIAAGRVFAAVTVLSELDTDVGTPIGSIANDIAGLFIIVIAYFGPFFLIPATFKVAGSAFSNISGLANDRSRGVFDRLKKGRQTRVAERGKRFREGELYNSENVAARAINRTGVGVGAGARGGFGFGDRGMQARARIARNKMAERVKDDTELQNFAQNDDDGIAMMFGSRGTRGGLRRGSEELREMWYQNRLQDNLDNGMGQPDAEREAAAHANQRRDRAVSAVRSMGISQSRSQAAGVLMMQNKARAVAGGNAGVAWVNQVANDVTAGQGAAAAEQYGGTLGYFARESGASHLGAGFETGTQAQLDQYGAQNQEEYRVARGFQRTGAHKVLRGHTTAVQSHVDNIAARLEHATQTNNPEAAFEAASEMIALRNADGQDVSEDSKRILFNGLAAIGVDLTSPESVDQQLAYGLSQAFGAPQADITQTLRDRAGLYDQAYDPAYQQYLAAQGGPGGSDFRIKRSIRFIGKYNKIRLYRFKYISSEIEYVGVIAQEIMFKYPKAIITKPNGILWVNYDVLGLRMRTYDEFLLDPDSIYIDKKAII